MEMETETQEIIFGEKPTDEEMETIVDDSDTLGELDQDQMQGLPEGGYYDYVLEIVPNLKIDAAIMLYHLCITEDEQQINMKLRLFEMRGPVNESPLANLLIICAFLQMKNATTRLHKYVAGLTSRTDEELNRIFPCELPMTKQNTLDEFRGWLTKNNTEMYRVLSEEIAKIEPEPEMPEDASAASVASKTSETSATSVASAQGSVPGSGPGPGSGSGQGPVPGSGPGELSQDEPDESGASAPGPVPVPVPGPGQVQSADDLLD